MMDLVPHHWYVDRATGQLVKFLRVASHAFTGATLVVYEELGLCKVLEHGDWILRYTDPVTYSETKKERA